MSAQVPDVLILDGEEVALFTNPLDSYIQCIGEGWPFASVWTANHRGYTATWELRDNVLLLLRLRGWLARRPLHGNTPGEVTIADNLVALRDLRSGMDRGASDSFDGPDIPLTVLFPGHAGPVEASWYSGTLRVPRGRLIASFGLPYSSVFERELRIAIDRGVVTSTVEIDPGEDPDESQRVALRGAGVALRARVDAAGWTRCPNCDIRFSVADPTCWDGERHTCGCRIRLCDDEAGRETPRES